MREVDTAKRRRERIANQAATTERLKKEVEAARDRYLKADEECKQVFELSRQLGLNHVDGAFAMRQATQQVNRALREYRSAVTRFCVFIVLGRRQKIDPQSGRNNGKAEKRTQIDGLPRRLLGLHVKVRE